MFINRDILHDEDDDDDQQFQFNKVKPFLTT